MSVRGICVVCVHGAVLRRKAAMHLLLLLHMLLLLLLGVVALLQHESSLVVLFLGEGSRHGAFLALALAPGGLLEFGLLDLATMQFFGLFTKNRSKYWEYAKQWCAISGST